jgi:hypothetical protein
MNERRETLPDGLWSLRVVNTTSSSYIGENDRLLHDGPIQQTTWTIEVPHEMQLGVFSSVPFSTPAMSKIMGTSWMFRLGGTGHFVVFH